MKLGTAGAKKHEGLILAVDGGATNCRAVLCTTDGDVLGSGRSGPCNYQNVGITVAIRSLEEAIGKALAPSRQKRKLKAAVFGLAGLDTRKDYRLVSDAVARMLARLGIESEETIVDNDGIISLLGAIGHENGVLVIAGTGSIACGITKQGNRSRAGGWGYLLDDAGSGYAIGKAALTHVMYVYDGRERESGVVKAILDQLAFADPEDIVDWVYSSSFSVDQVAALAPVVCRLAEEGDWKARGIVMDAVLSLKQLAMSVINRLGLRQTPFYLLLSGGVLQKATFLRAMLIDVIRTECPQAEFVDAQYPPICGSVLRALMYEDIDHRKVLARLNSQLFDIK
ncbi:N-acetylglucosamine kinase [Sporolituus thermophilus]|uniref:BadF-type ATPase n=1 Tax=Sporolituus thermophilus DSM 23256 TaxID=1123285 RepID=A0A1G7IMJ2_9FIRM|nr:BadF/BadG/BcrA/BcrD ATPase family protein [Sporolituus thermophilus]SDF13853.1 BadF-type ATPase [Sporolituus thermophilus DSM 23256]